MTDPKTIPCLHTFCKRCIEERRECPSCQAPLPRDGVASIPTNFSISRLVEIYGKRNECRQGLMMKCGKCEEDAPAITWCLDCDCEQALCRDCNELHRKWKVFKRHKTVPIDEFLQTPKQPLATPDSEKAEHCESHTKQTLDLYCKTCNSLICRDCTLKDHPREKHEFDFIDKSKILPAFIIPLCVF